MKGNEMELNGLIEEVLAQMRERKYGPKIYSHYQYSFSLLKSVAVDFGVISGTFPTGWSTGME